MERRCDPRADDRCIPSDLALFGVGGCLLHSQGGAAMMVLLGFLLLVAVAAIFGLLLYAAEALINSVERLASRDEHN